MCTVKARITPEYRVTSKYYDVTILIDEKNESVKDVQCSINCKASAGVFEIG